MYIKPSKNINDNNIYFGLNIEDLIWIATFMMAIKVGPLKNANGIIFLIIIFVALIFTSYVRINYRRKIITDFIRFKAAKLFRLSIRV